MTHSNATRFADVATHHSTSLRKGKKSFDSGMFFIMFGVLRASEIPPHMVRLHVYGVSTHLPRSIVVLNT